MHDLPSLESSTPQLPSPSTFVEIRQVMDLDQLTAIWTEAVQDDPEIKEYMAIITRCMTNGLLASIHMVDGFKGLLAVDADGPIGTIHILPRVYGKMCINYIKQWAFDSGVSELVIVANARNGSCFRFFEKTLGFRRKSVIFNMRLWQTTL